MLNSDISNHKKQNHVLKNQNWPNEARNQLWGRGARAPPPKLSTEVWCPPPHRAKRQ